jgi:hypothetical protein
MKTSKEADEKLKKAIDALTGYEKEYDFKTIVAKVMAEAEANDKSSMMVKEELPVRALGLQVTFASSLTNACPQPSVEEPTMVVAFLIHGSIFDSSPTIVKRESVRASSIWLAVLIPYASYAQSTFGLVRSSLDLQPSQGRRQTFVSKAESPLLRMAPNVTGGIWG